jgi:hypothetical protein
MQRVNAEKFGEWYVPRKFTLLLAALVVLLVVQSFFHGLAFHLISMHLGYSLVLLATVLTFADEPNIRRILLGLAFLTFVGTWVVFFLHGDLRREVVLVDRVVCGLFLSITTWVVTLRVILEENITVDTIMGSVCVYLLIGATWGVVYSVVGFVDREAFSMPESMAARMETASSDLSDWVYYSFMTLTTLGYSEIEPRSRVAGTLTWLEAMVGQFYMAVLVARLVGLHTVPNSPSPASGERPMGT